MTLWPRGKKLNGMIRPLSFRTITGDVNFVSFSLGTPVQTLNRLLLLFVKHGYGVFFNYSIRLGSCHVNASDTPEREWKILKRDECRVTVKNIEKLHQLITAPLNKRGFTYLRREP